MEPPSSLAALSAPPEGGGASPDRLATLLQQMQLQQHQFSALMSDELRSVQQQFASHHSFLAHCTHTLRTQASLAQMAIAASQAPDAATSGPAGDGATAPSWPSAAEATRALLEDAARMDGSNASVSTALRDEQNAMARQLGALLGACGAALESGDEGRAAAAETERQLRQARSQSAAAEDALTELRAETAKDKAFMLAVVNTLKEQLGEERAERAALRRALDAASAAHHATLDELRASHQSALEASAYSRAAEEAQHGRRACRQLHSRLAAFCERWVPAGAEAEKLALLEQLRELEEVLVAEAPGGPDRGRLDLGLPAPL